MKWFMDEMSTNSEHWAALAAFGVRCPEVLSTENEG